MVELNGFDANEVDPMLEFEPIPAGRYLAVIVASKDKDTKSGNGSYLELEFEVLEGEYRGRKLWSRLNLHNPSQKAVEIAQAELSSICRAVGVMTPKESADLHNIPLLIGVKCRTRGDTGDIVNDVSGYYPKPVAAGPSQSAGDNTSPPWAKG